jgi:hypothetical protein
MAIGVFGLQVAYKLKRLEVMSTTNTHGWFGGGFSTLSIVDRIDFSNDTETANIRSPLSSIRYQMAATGNSNYGWFGGGYAPPGATAQTKIERINFSNDLAATSIRGSLTITRVDPGATANSNYGWFGGGRLPSVPAFTTSVDRIDFSNDSSTASPRGPLNTPSGKSRLAATGNSNYGWFGGGTGPISTVDRIDFSNDSSTASPRGPLSSAKTILSATGNSNYGWFGGGGISTVDRIDFSNDFVSASVRGSLSSGKSGMSATGNSNYGWFGGGYSPTTLSIVDRIDFSNDNATASVRGPLTFTLSGRRLGSATSGQAKGPAIKLQKGGNFGLFGGGSGGSPVAPVATVERIDFSNDSATASPRGPLSSARYRLAATGNSNYGWFGGGAPGPLAIVDRINFSNDSATASPRGLLSRVRESLAATGNSNYGWFGGGAPGPVPVATVDRIDFSNDSATASIRGPLSIQRAALAATGNSNYGWFGGGFTGLTPSITATVDRIDFSNDNAAVSVRGPLSTERYYLAATENSNYGWFGGGITIPLPTPSGRVDRIDFSNDSATASIRGPLSTQRYGLAATGNSNYGWFGGGAIPASGPVATVDRIDFSNDSVTASPRGSLSQARNALSATSNTPVG